MFRSHLLLALRHLSRRKGHTAINVAGLAVGIACCALIGAFVRDELSYDRFHERADRLYRVVSDVQPPGPVPVDRLSSNGWPVGRLLRAGYPEVEAVTYLRRWPSFPVRHDGRYFYDRPLYADTSFFDVFTFPLVAGDPREALRAPFSAVLTERTARRYFGDESALGRPLVLGDSLRFTVTGVVRDVPRRSHLQFDLLLSFSTICALDPPLCEESFASGWYNMNVHNYLVLRPGASAEAFEGKMHDLVTRHTGPTDGFFTRLRIERATDVYLRSDRGNALGPSSDATYVYLLAVIGLFILVIASINYMNLATAVAAGRAREVGVRKAVGSSRALLVRQFLSESVLTALLALPGALLLVRAALPFFNRMAGKPFGMADLATPGATLALLGLSLLVGLLAGLYPAAVLSGFRPVETLKGAFATSRRGVRLRQALVVFQFAVSCALIVGTLVVWRQLGFMRAQELGFDRDQLLVVDAHRAPRELGRTYEQIKQALAGHAGVRGVSAAYALPGRSGWQGQFAYPEGRAQDDGLSLEYVSVDHDYVKTLGLEIVAGRDFDRALETDARTAILVNEAAVRAIGWGNPRDAVGKRLSSPGSGKPDGVVVGVVRDYHHHGLREPIRPIMYGIEPWALAYFALRIEPARAADVLAHAGRLWKERFPGHPFDYFFLDEDFDRQYQAEERLARIFSVFAGLAVLIACLGLLGLAAFTTVQRTKEIGIRKALGASAGSIALLLSRDFVRLVLAALLVAVPVSYLLMERWLADFAYRIRLGPGVFLLAGAAALAVALLTVSYHALRAARTDPARSLRYE